MKNTIKAFHCRMLKARHLKRALALVKRVFMQYEAPEYPQEGIDSFLTFLDIKQMKTAVKAGRRRFWGCFYKGKIIGTAALRDGNHICLMFVDSAYHARGIGRRLFELLSNSVKKNTDSAFITVNSSPYAVPFYQSLGFYSLNTEQTANGIRYIPMRYDL